MSYNLSRKNPPRIHVYSNNELNKCIECEKPLVEQYRTKERKVRRLGREEIIIEHIYACENINCSKFNQKLYPERQTPPDSSFYFEVIHEVGRLRREENMTFKDIIIKLQKQGTKIGNSDSCAQHLFNYYEIYEMIWSDRDLQKEGSTREVVLAMDGAKPENGVFTLYLITDVLNQDILGSEWLLYSGTNSIVKLLQKIKALDLNVKGFISDKQRALLLGVQEVFGEIPHQYCQFHWIREAGRPLSEYDRSLNKSLKKNLRKIRDITRAVERSVKKGKMPQQNLRFLKEIEPFLSVILQAKNKPPFILQGLKNWQRGKILLEKILSILSEVSIDALDGETRNLPLSHKSLILTARCLIDALKSSTTDMWNVSTAFKWLLKINEILNPKSESNEGMKRKRSSNNAKKDLDDFISQINTFNSSFLESLQAHIKKMFNHWEDGLFTCFDHPYIPRTNNALENLIYRIKKNHTKTTGRNNNHSLLRHQQCFRYIINFPKTDEFSRFCRSVSIKCYQEYRKHRIAMLAPIIKENRIKRNFSSMLNRSFDIIRQEMLLSSVCS